MTGILPWLTPLAALGLMFTMIGAGVVNARRGEFSNMAVNIILLSLIAIVAIGRFVAVPMVA